jgi:predicted transcriptional regulator
MAQRRSPYWIICETICACVEREEKQRRFKQEALEAWEACHQTGRHLTGQETRDWLYRWGTDEETPIPPCHG